MQSEENYQPEPLPLTIDEQQELSYEDYGGRVAMRYSLVEDIRPTIDRIMLPYTKALLYYYEGDNLEQTKSLHIEAIKQLVEKSGRDPSELALLVIVATQEKDNFPVTWLTETLQLYTLGLAIVDFFITNGHDEMEERLKDWTTHHSNLAEKKSCIVA